MAHLSFRDPVTNLLKSHGFVTSNDVGDLSQIEADDFNLTPGAWQWNGSAWIAYTPPPGPDERGFETDIYAAFDNDFSRINTVLAAFPVFAQLQSTLRDGNWPAASGIILATLGAGAITPTEYGSLKAAATARHIPLTLI